jgi:hypothetical protein
MKKKYTVLFQTAENEKSSKGMWWNHMNFCQQTEPVFLNIYGAQESIPRNEFHQPM